MRFSQIATSFPATVTWSGTDASGVAAYAAWLNTNGAWSRLTLATPTSRSVAITLTPGSGYRLAVAGLDTKGNWGNARITSTFGVAITQENGAHATYSSGWTRKAWAAASGGYLMSSGTATASATFTLTGSSVGWVAAKGPTKGVAKVYLDGVLYKTVDLYAAAYSGRVIAASYAWSAQGTHTIKVVVSGTAGRPTVDVDAFVVAG